VLDDAILRGTTVGHLTFLVFYGFVYVQAPIATDASCPIYGIHRYFGSMAKEREIRTVPMLGIGRYGPGY